MRQRKRQEVLNESVMPKLVSRVFLTYGINVKERRSPRKEVAQGLNWTKESWDNARVRMNWALIVLTPCFNIGTQQTLQRRFNVVFRLIWRRDIAQRQINVNNVVYVNVVIYNAQQRWKGIVNFNVEFNNVGQRRNSVGHMTIWKRKLSLKWKTKKYFWASKNMLDSQSLLFPHFKRNL